LENVVDTLFTDAAASCDLFLFLSGGSVSMGDGRVMVEPPPDVLDALSAPRHCVALDYLYLPFPSCVALFSFGTADITQIWHPFNTMYFSTSAA
jgi:hypothetical protein